MRLGLGIAPAQAQRRSGSAVPAFSPATLFTGGVAGAWYDPSDLSSLYQTTDTTTPVTAAGQSVARMSDKSGNARHMVPAVNSAPGIFRDAGGVRSIQLDGTDDNLFASGTGWPASADVFIAAENITDTTFIALSSENGGSYLGRAASGGAGTVLAAGAGTGTTWIDGVQFTGTTDGQLYTPLASGAKVIEFRNADLSAWNGVLLGYLPSAFAWASKWAGLIICPAQSDATRGQVRTYLAAKQGRTL